MKIDRLFSIVMLLLHRNKVSASEMASYFEVSVRTIQRDINDLCISGIPIVSEQGKNGGYSLMEGYKLDSTFIKKEEMDSLISVLKGFSSTLNDSNIKNIFEKINSCIDKNNQTHQKYIIDMAPWDSEKKLKSTIHLIESAIDQNNFLNFEYYDNNSKKSLRCVEPYSIVLKSNTWYLYAHCLKRNSYRLFRVSRMFNIKISKDHFEHRNDYIAPVFEDAFINNSQEVTLKFSPDIQGLLASYFPPSEWFINEFGFIEVVSKFPMDEWFFSFILGFGNHVEIIKPKYLREEIKERLIKTLLNYK